MWKLLPLWRWKKLFGLKIAFCAVLTSRPCNICPKQWSAMKRQSWSNSGWFSPYHWKLCKMQLTYFINKGPTRDLVKVNWTLNIPKCYWRQLPTRLLNFELLRSSVSIVGSLMLHGGLYLQNFEVQVFLHLKETEYVDELFVYIGVCLSLIELVFAASFLCKLAIKYNTHV